MPPPDPQTDVSLLQGSGLLTAANVNVPPHDIVLSWDAAHWLHSASGGVTQGSWRSLSSATFAAMLFGDTVGDLLLTERALHLQQISAAFRIALDHGLDATVNCGSLKAALHFFVAFCRAKRAANRAAFTFDDANAFFTLPGGQGAHPPAECLWFNSVTVRMGVQYGDALALAWLIVVLPGCWTRAGRRADDFIDAAGDLLDAAAATNPRLLDPNTANRRQAAGVMAFLSAAIPSAVLYRPLLSREVLQVVQTLRLSPDARFRAHFLAAWDIAFKHLATLLTDRCEAREAFSHVCTLLKDAPTEDSVIALDARVGGLLAFVNTPELRNPSALISDRVTAIKDQLLKKPRAATPGAAGTGVEATESSSEHVTKLLLDEDAKDLVAALEQLDVVPLVSHRVIRVALGHKHPAGALMLNGTSIDYPIFKTFKSCQFSRGEDPLVEAFKRRMCVEPPNILRLDWFHYLNVGNKAPKLPILLAKGTYAASDQLAFNPWLDLVQPLLIARNYSSYVPEQYTRLAEQDAAAIFTCAYMLRKGTPILVSAFGFVGIAADGQRSLKAVLDSCLSKTEQVDAIPDKLVDLSGSTFTWVTAKTAMHAAIRSAGIAAFCEQAAAYRSMLLAAPHMARRPDCFAPEAGSFWAGVERVDEMLVPIVAQVRLAQLAAMPINAGTGSNASVAPPSLAPTASPTQSIASLAASKQLSPSALALVTGAPSSPARSTLYSSLGPSPSQVAGSSSNMSAATRGQLLHTIEYDGNGIWFPTPYGRRWCSAVGPKQLDIKRLCVGSVAPPGVNPDDYCNKGAQCTHGLPAQFTATHSATGPPAEDKYIKTEAPIGSRGGKGGKGRGGKGRQQRGRRGRSF